MRNQTLWPQPSWLPRVDNCSRLRTRKEIIGITGAGGVLGSILRERLQDSGCDVHSFAGDVRDLGRVDGWVQGLRPTMLFHLAAVVPVDRVDDNPRVAWTTNVVGAVNVAVAACGFTHPWRPWVLLCSSSHAATPQASLYAASKHAAELAAAPLLERGGVPHCIARVFSFSHATQRAPFLVPSLRKAAETADRVPVRKSRAVRDIMDAESVVDALLHLAMGRCEGRIDIGSSVGRRVGEIAREVIGDKAVEMGGGELDVQVADVTALRSIAGGR